MVVAFWQHCFQLHLPFVHSTVAAFSIRLGHVAGHFVLLHIFGLRLQHCFQLHLPFLHSLSAASGIKPSLLAGLQVYTSQNVGGFWQHCLALHLPFLHSFLAAPLTSPSPALHLLASNVLHCTTVATVEVKPLLSASLLVASPSFPSTSLGLQQLFQLHLPFLQGMLSALSIRPVVWSNGHLTLLHILVDVGGDTGPSSGAAASVGGTTSIAFAGSALSLSVEGGNDAGAGADAGAEQSPHVFRHEVRPSGSLAGHLPRERMLGQYGAYVGSSLQPFCLGGGGLEGVLISGPGVVVVVVVATVTDDVQKPHVFRHAYEERSSRPLAGHLPRARMLGQYGAYVGSSLQGSAATEPKLDASAGLTKKKSEDAKKKTCMNMIGIELGMERGAW